MSAYQHEIELSAALPAVLAPADLTELHVDAFVADRVERALSLLERGDLEAGEASLLDTLGALERALDACASGLRHALASAMSDVACELGLCFAARGDSRAAAEVLVRCRRAFHDATLDG